ncbi:MAG: ABC transporter substrate-binding protein [Candidatus Marinimicrobia bacterium]|nr:ABC transporter substrate-binding protein [Candidatus Neomarinimicrobiota bacterium]
MKKVYLTKNTTFNGQIISLLPSVTGIICSLGLVDKIVGITSKCDIENSKHDIPICLENLDYENKLNINLIRELRPDIIFLKKQVYLDSIYFFNSLKKNGDNTIKYFFYSPQLLNDIFLKIKNIGELLDCFEGVSRLLLDMRIRIKTIVEENNRRKFTPKVLFLNCNNSIIVEGKWISEIIEIAGGMPLFDNSDNVNSREYSAQIFKQIIEKDPDFVLIGISGLNIFKFEDKMKLLTSNPEWEYLKAVRKNKVYIVDVNQYFNIPGISILNSIEIISEIIHPEKFIYEFEKMGWLQLIKN